MRVLHVTEASGSGTFEVVRTVAAGAAARGHEVHVALGRRPETPASDRAGLPDGVGLTWLPWEERSVRAQVAAARALRRLAARVAPDVVHLHSSFAGAVAAAVLAGRWPTIYTPHASPAARVSDPAPVRLAYGLVEAAVAARCAAVGAVSHAEADLVRRTARAREVAIVPNGLPDLDDPPAPRPRAGRPSVVTSGRIGPQRRPAATARILAAVADVADVAWIGGAPDGEDAPVRAAGVEVTGWLERDAGLDRLAEATACLHWSAWDGLSLALLEALARDVVVVASDIPANREVVGPEQACATEEEAVALLRAVVTDAPTRRRLLDAQRERRERWSATAMVEGWLAVYAHLIDRGRRADDAHVHTAAPSINAPWT